jgi:hypothetical protein
MRQNRVQIAINNYARGVIIQPLADLTAKGLSWIYDKNAETRFFSSSELGLGNDVGGIVVLGTTNQ